MNVYVTQWYIKLRKKNILDKKQEIYRFVKYHVLNYLSNNFKLLSQSLSSTVDA